MGVLLAKEVFTMDRVCVPAGLHGHHAIYEIEGKSEDARMVVPIDTQIDRSIEVINDVVGGGAVGAMQASNL